MRSMRPSTRNVLLTLRRSGLMRSNNTPKPVQLQHSRPHLVRNPSRFNNLTGINVHPHNTLHNATKDKIVQIAHKTANNVAIIKMTTGRTDKDVHRTSHSGIDINRVRGSGRGNSRDKLLRENICLRNKSQ